MTRIRVKTLVELGEVVERLKATADWLAGFEFSDLGSTEAVPDRVVKASSTEKEKDYGRTIQGH